jgi:putative ABC transport system substrate-binding protein
MRRRGFITLIGGAAAWPLAALAQQPAQMKRVGIVLPFAASYPEGKARIAAFQETLAGFGWVEGANLRTEIRWSGSNADDIRKNALELIALAPDVILADGSPSVAALSQATRAIPIVFALVIDPVGAGYVKSLAHPGGNVTGFMQFEYSVSGKWLELLKQISPGLTRVAVLRDPAITSGIGQFAVIQAAAPSLGIDVSPINMRDASEIENAIAGYAGSSNAGLIVTASALAVTHRDLIIALAAKHKLPAIYFQYQFATEGGLISYGSDPVEQYRRAAAYVDRVLKGDKPIDLPVQAPITYQLAINLRTAKGLGIDVPPTLLARADQVIE